MVEGVVKFFHADLHLSLPINGEYTLSVEGLRNTRPRDLICLYEVNPHDHHGFLRTLTSARSVAQCHHSTLLTLECVAVQQYVQEMSSCLQMEAVDQPFTPAAARLVKLVNDIVSGPSSVEQLLLIRM
jgi:hypothetical protein